MSSQAPYQIYLARTSYGQEEIAAVTRVLTDQPLMLVGGPSTRAFEARCAAALGHSHAVFCNSGSSANLLALRALDLPPGSEVITPALTFATTVAPIVQSGLVPVLVDVAPESCVVDVDAVARAITPDVRALLIPDLVGEVPDWPALRALADAHGLLVVEDGADTFGPTWEGLPTGRFADITTTSFYASHLMTCAGTGGLVATRDQALADRVRLLASWGRRSSLSGESDSLEHRFFTTLDGVDYDAKYVFDELGYNMLGPELGAAFGLAQLERLEAAVARRRRNVELLTAGLAPWRRWLTTPRQHAAVGTAWHAFPIWVRPEAPFGRRDLQMFLERAGVQTRPVMAGHMGRQPALSGVRHRVAPGGTPNSDHAFTHGLMVGCHQGLGDEEIGVLLGVMEQYLRGA